MKKVLLTITVGSLLLSSFIFPQKAAAQMNASDGTIKGVLSTEGAVIAEKQLMLDFTITDTTKAFTMNTCSCTITISQKGKLPYTQKFSNTTYDSFTANESHVQYLFPQAGTYNITVDGKPVTADAFQPFTLHWNFEVTKQSAQTFPGKTKQTAPNLLLVLLAVLLVGVIVVIAVFRKKLMN